MQDLVLPAARQWMTSPQCVLKPSDRVLDAIDRLVEFGMTAAPVVDDQGKLIGMLTEKDCLRILASVTYEHGWELGLVADYLSSDVVACEPDMDLFQVAERFLQNNFPVLPVVEGGDLLGTISRQDMMKGIQTLRRSLERTRKSFEERAGHQADRPRGIENMQRAAAQHSPKQLVQLFRR
ncbi:MAG: CBS domain-containing protein [Thermoanaerobaculia bacterium]|nr:CBS domain-containing protein [Thermoanaerobaculia bacterium]